MPSITEVDNIHEKTTDAGVTIGHDLKLSSGNAIKNASGVALLTEAGVLGSSVVFPAGHILQTLQYIGDTAQSAFSSETYDDVTDVAGEITITTGNDVFCICNPAIKASGGGTDGGLGLQLYDSTNDDEIVETIFYMYAINGHEFKSGGAWTLMRKFTPDSTTLTVKLRAKVTDGMTPTLSGGTLILMEVVE